MSTSNANSFRQSIRTATQALDTISRRIPDERHRTEFWTQIVRFGQERGGEPEFVVTQDQGFEDSTARESPQRNSHQPLTTTDQPPRGPIPIRSSSPLIPSGPPINAVLDLQDLRDRLGDDYGLRERPRLNEEQPSDDGSSEDQTPNVQDNRVADPVDGSRIIGPTRKRKRTQSNNNREPLAEIEALALDDEYVHRLVERVNRDADARGAHNKRKYATPDTVRSCIHFFADTFGDKGCGLLVDRVRQAIALYSADADLSPPALPDILSQPQSWTDDDGDAPPTATPASQLTIAATLADINETHVVKAYRGFRTKQLEAQITSVSTFLQLVAFRRQWNSLTEETSSEAQGQQQRTRAVGRGNRSLIIDQLSAAVVGTPPDQSQAHKAARKRIHNDIAQGGIYSDISTAFTPGIFFLFPRYTDNLMRSWGNATVSNVAREIVAHVPHTREACDFMGSLLFLAPGLRACTGPAFAALLRREAPNATSEARPLRLEHIFKHLPTP